MIRGAAEAMDILLVEFGMRGHRVQLFRLRTKTVVDVVAERDAYEALGVVNYEILPHLNKLEHPFWTRSSIIPNESRTMSWDSKMAPPLSTKRTACIDASDGLSDSAAGFGRRSRRRHNRLLRRCWIRTSGVKCTKSNTNLRGAPYLGSRQ